MTMIPFVPGAIKLLDEKIPGWALRIDLGRLAMLDWRTCLLGQLFGDFSTGFTFLKLKETMVAPAFLRAELRSAWVDHIQAQQEENAS